MADKALWAIQGVRAVPRRSSQLLYACHCTCQSLSSVGTTAVFCKLWTFIRPAPSFIQLHWLCSFAVSGAAHRRMDARQEQGQNQGRLLLVAVDDTDAASKAFAFAVHEMYKEGDQLHLVHVVPRLQFAAQYGVPAVDWTPVCNNADFEHVIQQAEQFIIERFVRTLPPDFKSPPVVHIIKSEVDTETVGHVLVKKAEELQALCIVMATHNKGRLKEFFLGSVTQYCIHNSKRPVVVIPDK